MLLAGVRAGEQPFRRQLAMRFRFLSLVWLCGTLAIPQVFAAEKPAPAALGLMESVLDSCSKAIPASASDYEKERKEVLQGVSDQDLTELRASDEYKGAYQQISDRFEKASKAEAGKTCTVFLGKENTPAKETQQDTQK
jgi:hypothetical protein